MSRGIGHTPLPALRRRPQPVAGDQVLAAVLAIVDGHGRPVSTLTGADVYANRFTGGRRAGFTGGRRAFECVMALLGVRQKSKGPPIRS